MPLHDGLPIHPPSWQLGLVLQVLGVMVEVVGYNKIAPFLPSRAWAGKALSQPNQATKGHCESLICHLRKY